MNISITHSWSLTPREAKEVQKQLRGKLILQNTISSQDIRVVAGADVSYHKKQNLLFGAVVYFSFPDLEFIGAEYAFRSVEFPYVPGLLSFREIPVLLEIFSRSTQSFDLLLCDAHGYAHPRHFGLACHLGVLLDKPTIGCAKSRLVGTFQEPGVVKGENTPLIFEDETVGLVVRTCDNVKPVFVSIGHRVDLEMAKRVVLACTNRYRLPEPLRQAHIAVNRYRKNYETRRETQYAGSEEKYI